MQTCRQLNVLSTPALYYHVKAVFEHPDITVQRKHNVFSTSESVLALGRNVGHVRQLDLEPLEITYYVNCVFAYLQQQQERALLATASPPPSDEDDSTMTTTNWDRQQRPLWLAPPDPHTCTVHPMRPMTQLTKLVIQVDYYKSYKDCPYLLPKFSDPKATLTYVCWIMDCNPFLQELNLEALVKDNRDLLLLTTSIFGLKFDRLQSDPGQVPIWQKSDQECGLLSSSTTTDVPMRQEPLTNLTALVLSDLNEEIVLEEEFRSVLEQCPNLEDIVMPTIAPIRNPKRLAQDIVQWCPRLIQVSHEYGIGDVAVWETMLWLLELLPEHQIQHFSCTGHALFTVPDLPANAGLLFWRHATTLKFIVLGGCRNFDSKAIQTILVGCSGLECLEVQWSARKDSRQQLCLELEDAIQVPWACTRLNYLALTVAIPDQPLHHPVEGVVPFYNRASPVTYSEAETRQFEILERFYQQIGALTELQTLALRAIFYDPEDLRPLAGVYRSNSFPGLLNLKNEATGRAGYLHLLGGLTKLKKLVGSVSMTTEETKVTVRTTDEPAWMVQHWPALLETQFYTIHEKIGTQFQWLKDEVANQGQGRRLNLNTWHHFE
ncbi:hypothetical protein BG015_002596 [Linnemannia schmuckeri]|uniref:Uncharacterized protein n=1 Tax=Linnemannia schmuckeri TaxID=64567 RepID=A0A9P5RRW4_9FUNG|nr:hypothetical protein BG015_002596 [Linnemannia schmuckeri]